MTTAREIAQAAGIGTRTRQFVLRDEFGMAYDGRRYELVLAALSRSDRAPLLPSRVRTVAYALRKSMVSARMPSLSSARIAEYSPYQLCALVARIVRECPETTIGGICDGWIARHHHEL